MDTDDKRFDGITAKIIGCAYKVGTKLVWVFGEVLRESARVELRKRGLKVAQQVPLKVWYDDIVVGEYVADLLVEEVVLVELKAIQGLDPVHAAICINHLGPA